MKHFQSYLYSRAFPFIGTDYYVQNAPSAKKREYSLNLVVDQFFSQAHRLKNGDVDTSPLALTDPEAAGHFDPVVGSSLPSDVSNEDIYSTIVSKDCQSLSEVSSLARLRPSDDGVLARSEPSVESSPSVDAN